MSDRMSMKGQKDSGMMPPLTMNQAKDLVRDGKQRPVERGAAIKTISHAVDEMDKFVDVEEDVWQKREEEALDKKSKKKAFRQAQKAESVGIKSSQKHSMKLRGNQASKMSIVQPGKFARDLHRHF